MDQENTDVKLKDFQDLLKSKKRRKREEERRRQVEDRIRRIEEEEKLEKKRKKWAEERRREIEENERRRRKEEGRREEGRREEGRRDEGIVRLKRLDFDETPRERKERRERERKIEEEKKRKQQEDNKRREEEIIKKWKMLNQENTDVKLKDLQDLLKSKKKKERERRKKEKEIIRMLEEEKEEEKRKEIRRIEEGRRRKEEEERRRKEKKGIRRKEKEGIRRKKDERMRRWEVRKIKMLDWREGRVKTAEDVKDTFNKFHIINRLLHFHNELAGKNKDHKDLLEWYLEKYANEFIREEEFIYTRPKFFNGNLSEHHFLSFNPNNRYVKENQYINDSMDTTKRVDTTFNHSLDFQVYRYVYYMLAYFVLIDFHFNHKLTYIVERNGTKIKIKKKENEFGFVNPRVEALLREKKISLPCGDLPQKFLMEITGRKEYTIPSESPIIQKRIFIKRWNGFMKVAKNKLQSMFTIEKFGFKLENIDEVSKIIPRFGVDSSSWFVDYWFHEVNPWPGNVFEKYIGEEGSYVVNWPAEALFKDKHGLIKKNQSISYIHNALTTFPTVKTMNWIYYFLRILKKNVSPEKFNFFATYIWDIYVLKILQNQHLEIHRSILRDDDIDERNYEKMVNIVSHFIMSSGIKLNEKKIFELSIDWLNTQHPINMQLRNKLGSSAIFTLVQLGQIKHYLNFMNIIRRKRWVSGFVNQKDFISAMNQISGFWFNTVQQNMDPMVRAKKAPFTELQKKWIIYICETFFDKTNLFVFNFSDYQYVSQIEQEGLKHIFFDISEFVRLKEEEETVIEDPYPYLN